MQMLRMANSWPILAIAFFFALLLGCKKDAFETTQNFSSSSLGESSKAADRSPITKEVAKNWFKSQYGDKKHILKQNSGDTIEFDIKPVWAFSTNGIYGTSTPMVIAPVQRIAPFDFGKQGVYFLLFYKDSLANIQARLVVCIGDDTYADGTKPKTLSDFNGLVMKMDLQGVFQNRISVTKCGYNITDALADPNATGIIWAYVDPFENGGGSMGSEGPKTGCYDFGKTWFEHQWGKIKNFFGGGPGGGSGGSGGSGVVWINTYWTPWGALGGTNGQGGVGGGGGGTGTTNTGNALEQYHFTNLYTNPMFQISEYFENMNINGEAYQIFGFLNSDGRQFLANEQNFIDIFSDFLIAHYNSTHARDFASDMIVLMIQFNVKDLTLDDIYYLFENLPGIEVATTPPNNTPISVAKPICSEIFSFKTQIDPVNHHEYAGMVLNNAYFQFNMPGGSPVTLTVLNMRIDAYANINVDCLVSCPAFAANSINIAVTQIQQLIDALPPGGTPKQIIDFVRFRFIKAIDAEFNTQVKNCNPAYLTDVRYLAGMFNNFDNVPVIDCDAEMAHCN